MDRSEMERKISEKTDRWMRYYSSCFDFIVKTTEMVFAKTLSNIDSVREGQAEKMKRLGEATGSSVVIVGDKSGSGELEEGVVYERYGIKAVSPHTFFSIIDGDFPLEISKRGGKYRTIDPVLLRKKRIEHGLSQEKLARLVGVAKKTIYMHEREERLAEKEVVDAIEDILGDVTRPVSKTSTRRKRDSMSVVDAGLFDIVASDSFTIYIKKYPDEKHISYLSEFNKRLEEKTLVITGKNTGKTIGDIPSITPSEFKKISKEELFSMFSS